MIGKASFIVIYNGNDISRDITGDVLSVNYRDKTEGEADELSMSIRNDSLKWLRKGWNPEKGDTFNIQIVHGGRGLDCGDFKVDEFGARGSRDGHFVEIRGLGGGVLTKMRTKSSFAHEGKSLKDIAQKYADKYGYRLQGIVHDYKLGRITQFHETDIGFLHRIAEEFGYIFSIKGKLLVFSYRPELCLQTANIVVDFKTSDMIDYSIRDKTEGIYQRGQNRVHNAQEKKVYDTLVNAGANPSVDIFRMYDTVNSEEEGLCKVDGRLYKKNMEQVEIQCVLPGNVYLVSGINVAFKNWGVYDGTYFISESGHQVDREGNYVSDVTFKKVLQNESVGNKKGTKVGYAQSAGAGSGSGEGGAHATITPYDQGEGIN